MKLFQQTVAIIVMIMINLSFLGCSNKKNQKKDIPKKSMLLPIKHQDNLQQEIVFHADGSLSVFSADKITNLVTIEYECADTPEKRSQGLMYRTSMNNQQGMLFIFEDAAPRYMYMKNTYIPLDILFFDDEKKIIKIHNNTQPLSEELLPSINSARYALEVNAGFCVQYKINEGDYLS